MCELANSSANSSLFARPGGGGESAAAAAAAAKLWARIWRDFFSTAFTSDDDDGQTKKIFIRQTDTQTDRQTYVDGEIERERYKERERKREKGMLENLPRNVGEGGCCWLCGQI